MAKSDRIDLMRKVYSKSEYIKIIDTNFSQLGVTTVEEDEENEVTVEQFFGYYNDLFYDIPAEGETNSHAYLVETSGEYIGFDAINEEIQALREEITGLREELLQTQIEGVATGAEIGGNAEIADAIRNEASLILDGDDLQTVSPIGSTTMGRDDIIPGGEPIN
tara:strand:+ start:1246 stop:1737 length:492 start_codon:yes stop_codon:yes gene_type:complete